MAQLGVTRAQGGAQRQGKADNSEIDPVRGKPRRSGRGRIARTA